MDSTVDADESLVKEPPKRLHVGVALEEMA